jgi:hypothetical protein
MPLFEFALSQPVHTLHQLDTVAVNDTFVGVRLFPLFYSNGDAVEVRGLLSDFLGCPTFFDSFGCGSTSTEQSPSSSRTPTATPTITYMPSTQLMRSPSPSPFNSTESDDDAWNEAAGEWLGAHVLWTTLASVGVVLICLCLIIIVVAVAVVGVLYARRN